MRDARLATIEKEIQGFVRNSFPGMVVRAEYWADDPSRIAVYFIDEAFRTLYPRQRYHRLMHLIPTDYYEASLADAVWFELSPGERPDDIVDPDEETIAAISTSVLQVLERKGFFRALDELFCPGDATRRQQTCSGDFQHARAVLRKCGIREADWSDIFHVLMEEGGFCDCEILSNVSVESRFRANYWRKKAQHQK